MTDNAREGVGKDKRGGRVERERKDSKINKARKRVRDRGRVIEKDRERELVSE